VRGALFHTQGVLKVNAKARVLRPGGSPIPGLYAGSGTKMGISGKGYEGYSSGNGLLAVTVLGKIAGAAAEPSGRGASEYRTRCPDPGPGALRKQGVYTDLEGENRRKCVVGTSGFY
jgi:hypothetical protein